MADKSARDMIEDLYENYDKETRHYILNHAASVLRHGNNAMRPYQRTLQGDEMKTADALADMYRDGGYTDVWGSRYNAAGTRTQPGDRARFHDDIMGVDPKVKINKVWSEGKDPQDVYKARLEKKSSGHYETSMRNGNYEDAAKWKRNAGKQFDPEADNRIQRYLQEESYNGVQA